MPRLTKAAALRRLPSLVVVLAATGLVAACSSTAGGGRSLGDRFFGAGADQRAEAEGEFPEGYFLKRGYCPPVEVRAGTEAFVAYQRTHEGDPDFVTYQGSITRIARECDTVGPDTMTIKVGVAGRVIAGPKGGQGTVALPLRIAVIKQQGGDVFYTAEFKIPATLTPPHFGAALAEVFDQVTFKLGPDDRDLIVFVGFDQGEPRGGA